MTHDFTFRNPENIPFTGHGHSIVNCTPHDIHIWGSSDEINLTIEPSGRAARCEIEFEQIGDFVQGPIDGYDLTKTCIPLFAVEFGGGAVTHDLPMPKENVWYIVSKIVATANPHRRDLLMVWDTVRDDSGKVVGCRGLSLPWTN